jgi:hypothetical protein
MEWRTESRFTRASVDGVTLTVSAARRETRGQVPGMSRHRSTILLTLDFADGPTIHALIDPANGRVVSHAERSGKLYTKKHCARLNELHRQMVPVTWARLISKVYHADPLICRSCGGRLEIVAYLHSRVAIKRILDHLGLSPPEQERPPPEIRYVPTDDEGHELSGMVAEAPPAP